MEESNAKRITITYDPEHGTLNWQYSNVNSNVEALGILSMVSNRMNAELFIEVQYHDGG